MNILTVAYDSTDYYLIQTNAGWLMVDTGWAGTLPKLLHVLKRRGIDAKAIKHLFVTHFHPDHAGLVEELKEQGATLILHTCQVPFVAGLQRLFKPEHHYKPITPAGTTVVSGAESRRLLGTLGLSGELVPTPGHSDDSVSLVIDGVCAFTGDLHPAPDETSASSWARIASYGVHQIYPGHGNPFEI